MIFILNLLRQKKYHWIDSMSVNACDSFSLKFGCLLDKVQNQPVFLCIGTPLLYGDCLGPFTGSRLKASGIPNVFGTLDTPVHAENIEYYRNMIKEKYGHPPIIAIDAALGSSAQTGYITLRQGALRPGKAIGKSIAPIGTIEITGIFDSISQRQVQSLMLFMSHIISGGIIKNIKKI